MYGSSVNALGSCHDWSSVLVFCAPADGSKAQCWSIIIIITSSSVLALTTGDWWVHLTFTVIQALHTCSRTNLVSADPHTNMQHNTDWVKTTDGLKTNQTLNKTTAFTCTALFSSISCVFFQRNKHLKYTFKSSTLSICVWRFLSQSISLKCLHSANFTVLFLWRFVHISFLKTWWKCVLIV